MSESERENESEREREREREMEREMERDMDRREREERVNENTSGPALICTPQALSREMVLPTFFHVNYPK